MTTPSTAISNMYSCFGPRGWLERCHPQYEYRAGQLQMAKAVEAAFREKRHLLVEAGTGTGKTLAYLIPAIASGQRVIISTGTKNLQDQLYHKDIPFLAQHLGRPLRVCYMKGRNNYLCRQKVYDAEKQPILRGLEQVEEFAEIREWERHTQTGDRAELEGLPESSELWSKLDARRETCTGQKCPQYERCFITEMHARALESDLVIVNHHLFFADLALRETEYASILPSYSAVIFDEAHEIEEVVGNYFGMSLSNYRIEELVRDCEQTLRFKDLVSVSRQRSLKRLRERANLFFSLFPAAEGRFGFEDRERFLETNFEAYSALQNALLRLDGELNSLRDKPEEIYPLLRRLAETRSELTFLLESQDRSFVFWYERRSRGIALQATPIDVSRILSEKLFEQTDTVVLTSATLSVGGSFEFMKSRLGIRYSREELLEPHFDYAEQTLLYIPQWMPDPRNEEFPQRAAEEVLRLLELSRGRAFVLFTSYLQMHQIFERVKDKVRYPLLLQGTAPKQALLEQFRSPEMAGAVLFATSSFWQGVDVPGAQLSAVIIDRLPFSVPSDPVVRARIESIRDEGGNPFFEYQVPDAVIALKQGFGRLIRSRADRGVLAILDTRIVKKGYGRLFLESLPPYRVTRDVADVESFFQQGATP